MKTNNALILWTFGNGCVIVGLKPQRQSVSAVGIPRVQIF